MNKLVSMISLLAVSRVGFSNPIDSHIPPPTCYDGSVCIMALSDCAWLGEYFRATFTMTKSIEKTCVAYNGQTSTFKVQKVETVYTESYRSPNALNECALRRDAIIQGVPSCH